MPGPHGRRQALAALLAVAVLAGVLALVRGSGPPAGAASGGARPAVPDLVRFLEQGGQLDRAVEVDVAANVRGRTSRLLASGHEVRLPDDGPVRLPGLPGVPRLVLAQDDSGRATGAAVQIPLSDGDTQPVAVDYVSTAFARLVTLPPFVTDDALELVVLRTLAEESPHLAGLAGEMRAHARVDASTFWAQPNAAEEREVAALAQDVATALTRTGAAVRPSAATGGPVFGFAALAAAETYRDCGPADASQSADPKETTTATGVCLFPRVNGDGSVELEAVNFGPSWAFLYTAQPGEAASRPFAAVRPRVRQWPAVQEIATALGKDLLTAGPRVAISWACKGFGGLTGVRCSSGLTDLDMKDLFASLDNKVKGIAEPGRLQLHLDPDRARHGLGAATGGGVHVEDQPPAGVPVDQLTSTRDAALMTSLYSQVVMPSIMLRTGAKRDARSAGEPVIGDNGLGGKHRGPDDNSEFVVPLLEALGRLSNDPAYGKVLTDLQSGEISRVVPGVIGFVGLLLASPEFLTAVIALEVPGALDWYAVALSEFRKSIALAAVPGLGWLKAVNKAVPAVGAIWGTWRFFQDLPRVADVHRWSPIIEPPTPPPPAAAVALPGLPQTATSAAALEGFLRAVPGLAPLPPDKGYDDGCVRVEVSGANLAGRAADLLLYGSGGACGGDAAGAFFSIRDGRVAASGAICGDCEPGTLDETDYGRLTEPYRDRAPSTFLARAKGTGWRLAAMPLASPGPLEAISDWVRTELHGELAGRCVPRAEKKPGPRLCHAWSHNSTLGEVYQVAFENATRASGVVAVAEQPGGWAVVDEFPYDGHKPPRWSKAGSDGGSGEPPECLGATGRARLPDYCPAK